MTAANGSIVLPYVVLTAMLLSPVQQLDFLFPKPLPSHKPPPSIQKLKTDRAAAGPHATPPVLEKCPAKSITRIRNYGFPLTVAVCVAS
jgi:hypothetical protein